MDHLVNHAKRRIDKIHFVGIGGAGMSGIAEVLHNLGFQVSGSDVAKNEATLRLASLGIQIAYSHIAENAMYCDALVVSTIIAKDNIEMTVARKRRIPIIHRAEMLAELMRFKYGIGVAGTHGKTTTTSLIATILADANLDPTFVVGGKLNKFSANAKLGTGEFFVAEADESDVSFLHLNPLFAVVTNIDADHLCNYANDFNNLKKAFLEFMHRLPFYGLAVVCKDDSEIANLIPEISRPLISYGFSENADIKAINYRQHENISKFQVLLPNEKIPRDITLNLPGKHNVLNALAAIAVAYELKIDFNSISQTLANFQGIGRRFQILGDFVLNSKKILLIDDYGHHPKEIEAVLLAISNGWAKRRIVMVFQPHRYTRTQELFNEFCKVLAAVEVVILLDIYSAGEQPIPNITSNSLIDNLLKTYNKQAVLADNKNDLFAALAEIVQPNDIILMQGAGDVGKLSADLVKKLADNQACVATSS